jgi:hypothetical protein
MAVRATSDLQTAAGQIDYEVLMFRASADLFAGIGSSTEREILQRNLYLEGFCIHARNLIDFLWEPRNVKPDDVLATHFVLDPSRWQAARPRKSALLQDAEVRVNKLAAHLTYSREKLPRDWNIGGILAEVCDALRQFGNNLSPERQKWFNHLPH